MIKEIAEALVEYKKANTALLAATQDPDMKETQDKVLYEGDSGQ